MTTPNDNEIVLALKNDAERGFKLLMVKYKAPSIGTFAVWSWRMMMRKTLRKKPLFACSARSLSFGVIVRSRLGYIVLPQMRPCDCLNNESESNSLDENETEANRLMADNYVDYTDLEAVKLQRAILLLPAKQQIAFNLRYYDELSYDEIAQITDSSAASVKTNYHLAKEKLSNT